MCSTIQIVVLIHAQAVYFLDDSYTKMYSFTDKDVFMDVSEVENAIKEQEHKLTVKHLRRILPIMMVILYKPDAEIAQKRKSKFEIYDKYAVGPMIPKCL